MLDADLKVTSLITSHDQRTRVLQMLQVFDHQLVTTVLTLDNFNVVPLLVCINDTIFDLLPITSWQALIMIAAMMFVLASECLVMLTLDSVVLRNAFLFFIYNRGLGVSERLLAHATGLTHVADEGLALLVTAEVVTLRGSLFVRF